MAAFTAVRNAATSNRNVQVESVDIGDADYPDEKDHIASHNLAMHMLDG